MGLLSPHADDCPAWSDQDRDPACRHFACPWTRQQPRATMAIGPAADQGSPAERTHATTGGPS